MALTKVLTGGIADDAIGNTKLALDANYAFTGTVTGAGVSTATSTLPSEGGAATTIVVQGLCKAWIHLTGTGTPAAVDSFNVASVTDTAAGRYTINITNDFASANYTCASMVGNDGTTASAVGTAIDLTPTAGAFAIRNLSGGVASDFTNVLLNFHGDLA